VSTYLPLGDSPAATVTMQELVTHHSGLSEFAPTTIHQALWKAPLGADFLDATADQVKQALKSDTLDGRGTYAYSTLGAAAAGQAVAAAAGMTYPDLMRTRLFSPLGMSDTAVQTTPLVRSGRATMGRPVQPWAMTGYAPGGGVSTSKNLAALALAILRTTAPGGHTLTGQPTRRGQNIHRALQPCRARVACSQQAECASLLQNRGSLCAQRGPVLVPHRHPTMERLFQPHQLVAYGDPPGGPYIRVVDETVPYCPP